MSSPTSRAIIVPQAAVTVMRTVLHDNENLWERGTSLHTWAARLSMSRNSVRNPWVAGDSGVMGVPGGARLASNSDYGRTRPPATEKIAGRVIRLDAGGAGLIRVGSLLPEAGAEVAGAGCVALFPVERRPHELLQVGRLSVQEQLVHRSDRQVFDESEVNAQADAGEQLHRLLGRHHGRRLEGAECPGDAVVQPLAVFAEQCRSGLPLVGDDLDVDVADVPEGVGLALAERDLVRDLVEVSRRPAALAVQAAHDEVDLLQSTEHLFDLLGQTQGGQVEHDAGPHAGADVG